LRKGAKIYASPHEIGIGRLGASTGWRFEKKEGF